jgi:hypothetical protein
MPFDENIYSFIKIPPIQKVFLFNPPGCEIQVQKRSDELAPAYVDLAIARWRMLYPDQPVTLSGDGRDHDAIVVAREGTLSDAA